MTEPDKEPTLIIYWADTYRPLTHAERKSLELSAVVISLTPREILIKLPKQNRTVAIRRAGDPHAPAVPPPRDSRR